MKKVIVVQARTGSTRLPAKVLNDLCGAPMLAQQLRRLKRCRLADEIVVATTVGSGDDRVVELAEAEGLRWHRGSEADVLSRYVGAAAESKADMIVRVTADCPLIDPEETDRVISELESRSKTHDYASNGIELTFPRGLDTEAFFRDVLDRMDHLASSRPAREHVTHFLLQERPELFVAHSVVDREDNSDLRWTVDTPEDFSLVRALYEGLSLAKNAIPYREILAYARAHPELGRLNAHIQQKQP